MTYDQLTCRFEHLLQDWQLNTPALPLFAATALFRGSVFYDLASVRRPIRYRPLPSIGSPDISVAVHLALPFLH